VSFSTEVILVVAGLIPSFIWLVYFLQRDSHPEPGSLLAKTFLMGIILSPFAILLQLGLVYFSNAAGYSITQTSSGFFLWAALVEECVKYYAVRLIILRNPAFDEPVDAMIYMMTAGLGFAAIENILVLFRAIPNGASAAFTIWGLRFAGATLLHALSSSLIGYFLALSWFFRQHHRKLLLVGIGLATLFHFSFNLFLSTANDQISGLLSATALLLVMAFLVSILFGKIKMRHLSNSRRSIQT
jgi:RsiW-degrading membrane proteinase PrsW (M82 family)